MTYLVDSSNVSRKTIQNSTTRISVKKPENNLYLSIKRQDENKTITFLKPLIYQINERKNRMK